MSSGAGAGGAGGAGGWARWRRFICLTIMKITKARKVRDGDGQQTAAGEHVGHLLRLGQAGAGRHRAAKHQGMPGG
jgi:hypothetical protein